ncbi:cell division protein FtsN [Neisseria sp. N95_16]|uniref:Cell division protein FtsN n=1 Tax=Neisseria brasiliensis TaxID=2666100 RepID=A0A5Q3RWN0_9NEIS|nr:MULTISPECIES: SPOR domain-containing protein [Neisseria]MRN37627.1 cell division protein FtsN [Neisseria brasiliensis]PJO10325.1 cell division protein FtsN [Neisseria sp. N95_16]PJO78155.1 cell division protein FtsN [Neisseria sp. N177_16]QGL24597.1 cell division protein FtsN [Neisseria brasiliensis]
MKKQTQHGKGIAGFISGLLLATAVIVGILFFLNKGNQNQFKELAQPEQTFEPEVLQPQTPPKPVEKPASEEVPVTPAETDSKASEADTAASEAQDTPSESEAPKADESKPAAPAVVPVPTPKATVEPKVTADTEDDRDAAERAAQEREERAAAEKKAAEAKRKAELAQKRAEKAKADKAAADKKAAAELTAERKLAEKKAAEKKAAEKKAADKKAADKKAADKKAAEKKTAKPTPEQILNSGSIEKARKAAGEEAKKSSKAADSKAATSAKSSGKKVIVQMGSYGDRASADAQRAKLAMMGVQSSVVEGSANGKKVYRLQSGVMAQDAAQRVQQTLKKNGVSSFTRSAQ